MQFCLFNICYNSLGPHYLGKVVKFKFITSDRNELRKSYNIDTDETFIVTRLNYVSYIVTIFVQTVHPSPAHKHEDGHATCQLHCNVNDGLFDAMPNVHQTLLELFNVVHP